MNEVKIKSKDYKGAISDLGIVINLIEKKNGWDPQKKSWELKKCLAFY